MCSKCRFLIAETVCVIQEEDTFTSELQDDKTVEYLYSLKMVNPSRMKDFLNVDLGRRCILYRSIQSLRKFIIKNLPSSPNINKPDIDKFEIGYFEPVFEREKGMVINK